MTVTKTSPGRAPVAPVAPCLVTVTPLFTEIGNSSTWDCSETVDVEYLRDCGGHYYCYEGETGSGYLEVKFEGGFSIQREEVVEL